MSGVHSRADQAHRSTLSAMAGLSDVMSKLASDPAFADAVRSNPTDALRGFDLSADDLVRIERVVAESRPPAPARLPSVRPRVLAGGVAAAAAIGLGVGFLTAPPSQAGAVIVDRASYFSCSDASTTGSVLGEFTRGDKVLVVGSSGPFAALRAPSGAGMVWIRADQIVPSGALDALPSVSCAFPIAPSSRTPTASALPTPTAPPSTSTAPSPVPATSSAPASASTTTASTTKPTTSTTTLLPLTVQVDTDLGLFYSEGGSSCGSYPQYLSVFVRLSTASSVGSITVRWSGAGKTGTATKVAPDKWSIGPIYSNHSGTVALTVTVTVVDKAGRTITKTKTVNFAQIAEVCIG